MKKETGYARAQVQLEVGRMHANIAEAICACMTHVIMLTQNKE